MNDKLFKSIIDQDMAPIVICGTDHTILYLNPAALKRYEKRGGASLIGKSLHGCHNAKSCEMIDKALAWFLKSSDNNIIHTYFDKKENKDVYMVALRDDDGTLIGYYEKHEYRTKDETASYEFS